MGDQLVAALISVGGVIFVGVATALWTVGGPGALLRRTVKQELELRDATQSRFLQREVQAIIDGRIVGYVARLTPLPRAEHVRLIRRGLLLTAASGVLTAAGLILTAQAPEDSALVLALLIVLLVATGVLQVVVGRTLGRVWLSQWARDRRRRVARHREQLDDAQDRRPGS